MEYKMETVLSLWIRSLTAYRGGSWVLGSVLVPHWDSFKNHFLSALYTYYVYTYTYAVLGRV